MSDPDAIPAAPPVPAGGGNLRGILWLMAAIPCFQLMNVMLRQVAVDLPPVEVMFFRNTFGFIVLLPWLLYAGGMRALRTRRLGHNMLRATCHVGGMVLWVYALTLTPLATANALMFTSPLFVAIGAVLFMGERSHWPRWLAIAVGFAGTLVIIRPGFTAPPVGMLLVLGAALLLAGSKMLVKVITRTDTTFAAVFYLNLFMAMVAFVPALFVWHWPSWQHYGWFVALALVGAVAHLTLTRAITSADLSLLQPFEFVMLAWAALLGFVIFAEVPEVWVFIGGGVIVLAASMLARHEAGPVRLARPRLPDRLSST